MAIAVLDAAGRGPWLDEFWTLELSDTTDGLVALIRDGWLRDAHPPLFSAWATLLSSLGVSSIAVGRLVSNLLAAALMLLAARRLAQRMPAQASFNTMLMLLVLSLPEAMEAFANYRSYFWQVAALATLAMVARHVAALRIDLDLRKEADLAVIAALATGGAIGLHYIGGLFGGLLAGAIALSAFRRGLWRWAAVMLASAALASVLIVASVALQMPNWASEFDHSWIDLPLLDAMVVPVAIVAGAIAHNPAPLVGLVIGRAPLDTPERRVVAMIGGVLVAGLAIVLAVHAFKPIVVERYLISVPVLVCALMAIPATRLAQGSVAFGVLVLVSMAVAASPLIRSGIKPQWHESARTIAGIVAACPTTQVFAASGWVLGPASETRTAMREDPVFTRAYRWLAGRHGFTVHFIGLNDADRAMPGACPVLLWYEHTPNDAENDLPGAIEVAGLTGLEGTHLSVIRSATGFVVRADRYSPR